MKLTYLLAPALIALAACAEPEAAPAPEPQPDPQETATAPAEAAAPHAPTITQLGGDLPTPFPGHDMATLIGPDDTAASVAFIEFVVPAKSPAAPPHTHADEDEYFLVLEGELTFLNGDETITAGPGTLAAMTRGNRHAFWNNSEAPARGLLAVAPGDFASFFDQVVMEIRAQNAADPAAIGGIVAAEAAKHNVIVDMSQLPPELAALMGPPPQ